jgi:hypothetical protein
VSFCARLWVGLQNFGLEVSLKKVLYLYNFIYVFFFVVGASIATEVRPDGWTHYMFFLRGDEGRVL